MIGFGLRDDIEGQNRMTSGGILIHLMRPTPSIFHSFIEHHNHIVNIRAIYNDQILNEKPVRWIPSAVQNSRRQVE